MQSSDSGSSLASSGSTRSRDPSSPFAYQTRLLERTSSRGNAGALSRNTSVSSKPSFVSPTTTGSSAVTPVGARKWTPSHRVGSSLDTVRGKWEERVRAEAQLESRRPASPSKEFMPRSDSSSSSVLPQQFTPTSNLISGSASSDNLPSSFVRHADNSPLHTTPTFLKRHTLPAHITTTPLSPNTTGLTIENPDIHSSAFTTPTSHRIHLPTSIPFQSSSISSVKESSEYASSDPFSSSPSRTRRSSTPNTVELKISAIQGSSQLPDISSISSNAASQPSRPLFTPTSTTSSSHRRPTSFHGSQYSVPSSPTKLAHISTPSLNLSDTAPGLSAHRSGRSFSPDMQSPAPSMTSPTVYRSAYMTNKKSAAYGQIGGRKLGRHLPRIASGDANVDFSEEPREDPDHDVKELRKRRSIVSSQSQLSFAQELIGTGITDTDDVAGVPGRLRLSRDREPSTPTSPLPSARLTRGLWADTQRHLLQAYEYLCHVGEAQQWIEGCLGEELGFGVVEMEEGLRNGVVVAKLVRAFQGERVVRKIYEAPKLDFRHSDNINYFVTFVREVGLPEGFIFELTDLYEKKNLPKVIYCIHALSHLLARRGMAERIGNLLGQLQFSDDQLQKTQKGLNDAGVVMPNFSNVGKELAKEIHEEPEIEIETENQRRDRLLLECESCILVVQRHARGFLVRKAQAMQRARLRLAERYIPRLQARCRGVLIRRRVEQSRQQNVDLTPWAVVLQTALRSAIARNHWRSYQRAIKGIGSQMVPVQAQIRGVLQRRHHGQMKLSLRNSIIPLTKLQSTIRGRIVRQNHRQIAKAFEHTAIASSVINFQAAARGFLNRARLSKRLTVLQLFETGIVGLQSQSRGALMRRSIRMQLAKLEDVTSTVIRIQAAARTYLARKHLLGLTRSLRRASPIVISIQARARASLTRQKQRGVSKALSEVRIVSSVGMFQSMARATLARNRHREQQKRLDFVEPDTRGLQAIARGFLIRRDYFRWRDHLRRNGPVATLLQALLRGVMQRKRFHDKMAYYKSNLQKVVKIQSLFRAKEMREQYRQLTLGRNVTVGTIKNFVHLLDDSEADFQEEIKVERLRKKVVETIRENQALENDVSDLDVKIALVVQNVKSFEELIKARRKYGGDTAAAHATRASILAAHGDPFAGPNTLDHTAKKKLELYQQIFYLLQTKGEYLSKLFVRISKEDSPEKNRRLTERVVLTLFGYGQGRREDYLLLKLFQFAIQEETAAAPDISAVVHGHPMYMNIAVHYVRPKQVVYVRETLQALIREVVEAKDLDLEADPSVIRRSRIEIEEMRSGIASTQPKDLPFHEALNDPDTRAEYIRHLQKLQWWTEAFVGSIIQSTKRMPYSLRFLTREMLLSLRARFPDASEDMHAACIGRLVYYRYLNPAIITPETFDIVSTAIDVAARKNLAQISRVLTQIASGSEFGDDHPNYIPVNDYVRKAVKELVAWMLDVADVNDAETQLNAYEFLDVAVQPKPIYISPNEIYSMHALLSQYQDDLTTSRGDPLRVILHELDGVPHFGSDELRDARDKAITLTLTNRFAHVRDPQADEKALWVQAKRGVLAILRVQPAQDLVESLMRPVNDDDEIRWEIILEEMENEPISRRMPSAVAADSAYRLEDIRSLSFKEVKAHAIFYLLELEKQGKISRDDGFQGILNAIASDVRSKHRKRLQRQQETDSMVEALKHLNERKKYFQEQIDSYHSYVEAAMATMQRGKGKKRFVLPFTKQYFHMRDLQKSGKSPQFGSFKYSAKELYEKGILLSIDQFSPRQFDKIDVIISSNTTGIFTIEILNNTLGITNRIATADLRMEDLLQAQFENQASLSLFDGLVKVNLNLFLYQINKKFYV